VFLLVAVDAEDLGLFFPGQLAHLVVVAGEPDGDEILGDQADDAAVGE
jgi:hypothetical protein